MENRRFHQSLSDGIFRQRNVINLAENPHLLFVFLQRSCNFRVVNLKIRTYGTQQNCEKTKFEKREEEKANRLFKMICIVLILLAILMIVGYTLAS